MLIEKSEEYTGVYGRSPDILFCAHEEVPTHRINNVQIDIDKRFMFLILRYETGGNEIGRKLNLQTSIEIAKPFRNNFANISAAGKPNDYR